MKSKRGTSELVKEIELLMTYGVEEGEKQEALAFLSKCKNNMVALTVLHDFYLSLPGAQEEPVVRMVLVENSQGVYLLGVDALRHEYLYFATADKAGCIGAWEEGIEDQEVLSFFGFSSNDEFQKKYAVLNKLQDFCLEDVTQTTACPVCFAKEGECHQLGCAVEICPWCDAQLNRCNCRFDKLEMDEIESDEDLSTFEEMLLEKGRIPFAKAQAPAYPEDRAARVTDKK